MQLDERKNRILKAIVKLYIATGEPVGSKLLTNVAGLNLSSATIRNEMSELAEMGFLEQPHTSAGRIPSQKGYRLYVDSLMEAYKLTREEINRINEMMRIDGSDLESLLERAGEVLADLTGCVAVSAAPQNKNVKVRRIEIVPAGRKSMLIVILVDSGVIKSRLCRVEDDLNADMVGFFAQLLNERVCGRTLGSLTDELLQEMTGELYEYTYALRPVLGIIFEEIKGLTSNSEVFLGGEANLLGHREFDNDKALQMIRFLEKRDELARLIEGINGGISVRIGTENQPFYMQKSSLIAAPYAIDGKLAGTVGIIGPTRMNYPKLMSNLEYFSSVLSRLINETFMD